MGKAVLGRQHESLVDHRPAAVVHLAMLLERAPNANNPGPGCLGLLTVQDFVCRCIGETSATVNHAGHGIRAGFKGLFVLEVQFRTESMVDLP